MQNRMKLLRKNLHLTQAAFAEKISMSQNFIAQIEIGKKIPSDRTIYDICREFNVNETWLRTGEGEMFVPKDLDDELADFMGSVLREDIRTSLRKQLIDLMAHIPPDMWSDIAVIAQQRAEQYRQSLPPNNKED